MSHPYSDNAHGFVKRAFLSGWIGSHEIMRVFSFAEGWLDDQYDWEGDDYGSSDYNADAAAMLDAFGIKHKVVDGRYVREDGWKPEPFEARESFLKGMEELLS